jgi:hypothetical protein
MVSNLDDNNKDVQDTTEIMEDNGLFKCKICGVNLIMLVLMKVTLQQVT